MGFFLPLLGAGLGIGSKLLDYKSAKDAARMARDREREKQVTAVNQFLVEQRAREAEMNLQMVQLTNQQQETEAIADSQKGDIALAAQAAQSRALA